MDEQQLEQVIADLVARKYRARQGSAEREFIQRTLNGLRYTYELAGGIWEDVDPNGWGATPP